MISIIITTYKRDNKTVRRAIESVLEQTYKNWELFVIDDSPNDFEGRQEVKRTVEGSKDNRIKYIPLKKNMGACYARNKGLELSSGEYVCFLDDDDAWRKDKLEKQYAKFKELDNNYALVYCGATYYDEIKEIYKQHKNIYKSGKVFDELITRNFIGGSSFPMIKTSVIKSLGGFDTNLLAAQDLDMWLRIAKDYLIDCVREPLVIYYQHEGEQISTSPKKRLQGMQKKIEKNKDYLEKHPKQHALCLLDLAYAVAMNRHLWKAFGILEQAQKIHRFKRFFMLKAYARTIKQYLIQAIR